jgi:hypothetical protein
MIRQFRTTTSDAKASGATAKKISIAIINRGKPQGMDTGLPIKLCEMGLDKENITI